MKHGVICVTIVVSALNLLTGCRDSSSTNRAANPSDEQVQLELRALREELAKTRSQAQRQLPNPNESARDIGNSLQQWSLSDERPSSRTPTAPEPNDQRVEYPPTQSAPEQMLQFLILQGLAEQQRQQQTRNDQQYQKFQHAAEQARTCQACVSVATVASWTGW